MPIQTIQTQRSIMGVHCLAAGQGFEPRYHPPEGCVLPLDDPAIQVKLYQTLRLFAHKYFAKNKFVKEATG